MRQIVSLLLLLGCASLAWADDVDDFVQRQMEKRHDPGLYEFAPGLILEIAPGDNKLLLKQGERAREFLPEANDAFYREDSETVLRFETDGAGMVTHMILDNGAGPQKIKRIP